jgi:hypothetical protein
MPHWQAEMRGIDLEIEHRSLHRLLLLRGQAGQAVRKGVRQEEVHG